MMFSRQLEIKVIIKYIEYKLISILSIIPRLVVITFFSVMLLSCAVFKEDEKILKTEPDVQPGSSVSSASVFDDDPEMLMDGEPIDIEIPTAIALGRPTENTISRSDTLTTAGPVFSPLNLPSNTQADTDSDSQIEIHTLNIGAGSCHIIDCPNTNLSMVVDCGSMNPSDTDLDATEVKNYLNNVIDGEYILVLSHADRDHVNRIPFALNDMRPKSIWLGGELTSYRGKIGEFIKKWFQNDVPVYHGWSAKYANRGNAVKELQCGDAMSYILTVNVGSSKNSRSLVLLTQYGNFKAIFSGDAHGITERAVMDSFGALIERVTLLTASHHGAKTHSSNHDVWTDKVNPQVIIYSSGLSHGHPNTGVVSDYQDNVEENVLSHEVWSSTSRSSPYVKRNSRRAEYVTEMNGTVIVRSNGFDYDVECSFDDTCF